MRTNNLLLTLAFAAVTLLAIAQEPTVINAHFHSGPASPGLSATVDRFRNSGERLWLGYQVQALPRTHLSACSAWEGRRDVEAGCCSEYRLEEPKDDMNFTDRAEEAAALNVLLRVDHGEITRVRLMPADCKLDAGGLAFEWLNGVSAEESASFLGGLAAKENIAIDSGRKLADESLAALSLHATPKATGELTALAASGNPTQLREKAAFWLGAQRGHDGLVALRQLIKTETDPEFRKKLAFDLSVNSDPAAVDDLLQMAKSDPDSGARGQALFWLAQKASKKAVAAISNAVENDPNVEVKKKAVFALSQLPKDESIPQLEHVANTNSSPEVRKAAIFWLGQTNDPRALAYLEDLLKR
jgi:hypothetical protein